jgi:hypothetical protein
MTCLFAKTDIKLLPSSDGLCDKTFNIFGSTRINFFAAANRAAQAGGLSGAFNYPNKTATGDRVGGGILRETGSGIPVELGGRYTSGHGAIYLSQALAARNGATHAGAHGWSQRIIEAALNGHPPGSHLTSEGGTRMSHNLDDASTIYGADHGPAARYRSPRVDREPPDRRRNGPCTHADPAQATTQATT